jgi:hypothetical protein
VRKRQVFNKSKEKAITTMEHMLREAPKLAITSFDQLVFCAT